MICSDTNFILLAVLLGQAHALGHRAIWRNLDCWSAITLRNKLAELAKAGVIQRRSVKHASGFHWVYWRETKPVVCPQSSTVMAAG